MAVKQVLTLTMKISRWVKEETMLQMVMLLRQVLLAQLTKKNPIEVQLPLVTTKMVLLRKILKKTMPIRLQLL